MIKREGERERETLSFVHFRSISFLNESDQRWKEVLSCQNSLAMLFPVSLPFCRFLSLSAVLLDSDRL